MIVAVAVHRELAGYMQARICLTRPSVGAISVIYTFFALDFQGDQTLRSHSAGTTARHQIRATAGRVSASALPARPGCHYPARMSTNALSSCAMRTLRWATGLLLALWMVVPAAAQAPESLALDGRINDAGTVLELQWPPVRGATIVVERRILDESGPDSWQDLAPSSLTGFRMVDDTLQPGTAFEYRVRVAQAGRKGPGKVWIGTWAAGIDVAARIEEGAALLIVDETIADDISPALDQFTDNLTGAGWQVTRHLAPRADDADKAANLRDAAEIRRWISTQYEDSGKPRTAIIFVGHIPVVHTGLSAPDGHAQRAMPSDLYYADPDGFWPTTQSTDGVPQLLPTLLPRPIKMQIGRIDFSGLDEAFGTEVDLINAYFQRNHRWRHGEMGDRRLAYGQNRNLRVEQNDLVNIVGKQGVTTAGHHDAGGNAYLMGVDFGDWRGAAYVDLPPSHAVFAINFGSNKQMFDAGNNAMKALLAQPGDVLAVGWGGRPAWHLHGMAMGESIGGAHLRTVNNGLSADGPVAPDYPSMGNYQWNRPVWVNLLGDPTLRPFPLQPVAALSAQVTDTGVRLTWTAPEGADGAMVFRADGPDGTWLPMNNGRVVAGNEFNDPSPQAASRYLVRAAGLARVNAGSFHRLAQGVVANAPNISE